MKKLLIIFVFGCVSLSSIGIVRAEQPYVYLSAPQKNVDLGTILIWDTVIPGALTLKVNSNTLHGPVIASISPLKNIYGNQIMKDRIFIRTSYTGGFISMAGPVVISESAIGSHDINIDFQVKANGISIDNPGMYSGTLVFTVMPPVR